jgi:hypothetical protein
MIEWEISDSGVIGDLANYPPNHLIIPMSRRQEDRPDPDAEFASDESQPASQPPTKSRKILRGNVPDDEWGLAVQHKASTYVGHAFHTISPGCGPARPIPTPGERSVLPHSFLVHRTYPMLFSGVLENGEYILDFQFCDVCKKWLKTGVAVQNGERHCLRQHPPSTQIDTRVSPPDLNMTSVRIWVMIQYFIRCLVPIGHCEDVLFCRIGPRRKLWQILAEIKNDVDQELHTCLTELGHLNLIEDGWTDSVMRPYEGVWATGIDHGGSYKTFCVGQLPLKRADAITTASAIAKRLHQLKILDDSHKVRYFVGDSAAVNPAMVRQFNQTTDNASEFVPCAAHAFNNMMQAIWSKVRPLLSRLLIVIEAIRNKTDFRRLTAEWRLSAEATTQDFRKGPMAIATATPVRWYSLVRMLSSAISLRPVIESYLRDLSDPKLKKRLSRGLESQCRHTS